MKLLLTFFITLISLFCFSQDEEKEDLLANTKRNTIYFELGGSGVAYSFNFDRILTKKRLMTSFSIGATCFGKSNSFYRSQTNVGIPVSYNLIFGKKNHMFELGVGATLFYSKGIFDLLDQVHDEKGTSTYLHLKCGYRYQKPSGGIFYKALFTPLIQAWVFGKYKILEDKFDSQNINTVHTIRDHFGPFPWIGFSVGYTLKK